MPTESPTFSTYDDFWLFYLRQHAKPGTRWLHVAGTGLGLALLVAAAVTGMWGLAVAAPIVGYAFAWIGHIAVEGNRPATFGHPVWSLFSDLRMVVLWATGRLSRHLREAGIDPHHGFNNASGQ